MIGSDAAPGAEPAGLRIIADMAGLQDELVLAVAGMGSLPGLALPALVAAGLDSRGSRGL